MGRAKLSFPNAAGQRLAGLLELPPTGTPIRRYALFAHCFTCGKDIAAASRISRAMADRGIAVLRFDFTGLGNSDGDFANSNFTSNVDDLISAADALGRDYQAPALLIGHSLGGAAVLAAASRLPSVEAVVTIASPATAQHVTHLFEHSRNTLETAGSARVKIGGRTFEIRRQLLDDLERYADADHLHELGRPLLVFHSPRDQIVSIREAAKIYRAARHPKSFISLDHADHLLSRREDAEYVAETMVAWASRYLGLSRVRQERSRGTAPEVSPGEVLVTEMDKRFLRGLYADHHQINSDRPRAAGGSDLGPSPYELLLMSLGACTSMTIRQVANRLEIPLDDVAVTLRHDRSDARDDAAGSVAVGPIRRIEQVIELYGRLSDDDRRRLLEAAGLCPVLAVLEKALTVTTELDV
jgi:putative redox protein